MRASLFCQITSSSSKSTWKTIQIYAAKYYMKYMIPLLEDTPESQTLGTSSNDVITAPNYTNLSKTTSEDAPNVKKPKSLHI